MNLNDPQQLAVTAAETNLLVIAGAGSGKTRVLVERMAFLMREQGLSPHALMAVTFTNKAAREMRERLERELYGRSAAGGEIARMVVAHEGGAHEEAQDAGALQLQCRHYGRCSTRATDRHPQPHLSLCGRSASLRASARYARTCVSSVSRARSLVWVRARLSGRRCVSPWRSLVRRDLR